MLTSKDVAKLLGIDERTLRRWKNDGMPAFESGEVGNWYVERKLKERFGDAANGEGLDFTAERARVAKEQADKLAMENDARRDMTMTRGEVAALLTRVIMIFKTRLMTIPMKLAPLLFGMKSIPEIMEALKAAIYEALNELSVELSIEADKAAAGSDGKQVGRRKPKAKSGGKRGAGKVAKR